MGEIINGIDVEKLSELLKQAEENRELISKLNKWYTRIRWSGAGFDFKAYVRNHTFLISEVSELGGEDKSPNPVEYVLSALGACLGVGFVFNATKKGIKIRNLEIALEGEIDNILVFLDLSDQGHPGYKRIIAKAYVDADADEGTIYEIWKETVRTSPVGNTLQRNVDIIPEVRIVR